jgi:hypothetical protein
MSRVVWFSSFYAFYDLQFHLGCHK